VPLIIENIILLDFNIIVLNLVIIILLQLYYNGLHNYTDYNTDYIIVIIII